LRLETDHPFIRGGARDCKQRVFHDVSHMHESPAARLQSAPLARLKLNEPLIAQVVTSGFGGRKQQPAQMISHNAINLLRHASIEAAESGFDVCKWDLHLGGY